MQQEIHFTQKEYGNGITAITAPMQEQIYLVQGSKKALLIDNGMGIGSLKTYVESFCNLPLLILNTHGHPDHAGGNAEFDWAWLHAADHVLYRQMCTIPFRAGDINAIFGQDGVTFEQALLPFCDNVRPIEDGAQIDLGERILDVFLLPGHTKGSVLAYDRASRILFGADSLNTNNTWLYLDYCTPLETYLHSLQQFRDRQPDIRLILAGHLPREGTPDLIDRKIRCVERILKQEAVGVFHKTFAGEGLFYEWEETSIVYNPDRLYCGQEVSAWSQGK